MSIFVIAKSATLALLCSPVSACVHSYIVSSYYEIGYSSRGDNDHPSLGPMTVPIDFLTVAVLSRKLPPPEVANRIDDFLDSFRETLQKMPESEIQSHADALSSKFGSSCSLQSKAFHL